MAPSELSERRHRLKSVAATQRDQLAHDWVMLKHSVSPSRNIKRYSKPLAIGVVAVVGAMTLYALRRRLSMLLWLPRLWLARRLPGADSLTQRLFAHFPRSRWARRSRRGPPVATGR